MSSHYSLDELSDYLNNSIDNEKANLSNHINLCSECNKKLDSLKTEDASIRRVLSETPVYFNPAFIRKGRKPPISILWLSAAAIFIFVIALGIFQPKSDEIQIISGQATRENGKIYTQDKTAKVLLSDKTRVVMKENTVLQVSAPRKLELIKGEAIIDVAKKQETFSVETKFAKINVLGTRFSAILDSKKLTVKVDSGRVKVENNLGFEILEAGETVFCSEDTKPTKRDDQIDTLRSLIKQLGDNDPSVRDKAQEKIEGLVKITDQNNRKELANEIKKVIDETNDLEVKLRLEAIWKYVTRGKWTMLADAPIERRFLHCACVINNKLIIWGGCDGGFEYYNNGAIYDIKERKWVNLPDAPIGKRSALSGVATDNELIIWGGHSGGFEYYNNGAIYDIKERKWVNLPDAPIGERDRHSTSVIDNKLIIWGGNYGFLKYYNDGAIYDIKERKWVNLPDAPIRERDGHSTSVIDNKLIIWGGFSGTLLQIPYNDGAIYDVKEMKWKKLPDAPIGGRKGHSSNIIDNKLIIWGGDSGSGKYCNDGAIYDVKEMKWKKLPDAPIGGRKGHSSNVIDNKLIIWGGQSSGGNKSYNDGTIYELPLVWDIK